MISLKIWAIIGVTMLFGVDLTMARADDDPATRLASGGYVLMLRHALAPGTGDPDNFKIDDCATQRNLNSEGRAQARDIGRWLRERGIDAARVYSSQWCRCLETAELLNLGPVEKLPALNSFFRHPQERDARVRELEQFLATQPRDGQLVVLVTHMVNILAFTGESVSSGEAVVMRLIPDMPIEMSGRLRFDNAP